jgi:hypothetical protein
MSKYDDYGYKDPRSDPDSREQREYPTRFNKRKNTKRWCKGKVGREHQPVIVYDERYLRWHKECHVAPSWAYRSMKGWYCIHLEVCTNCGKHLRWRVPKEECPDYRRVNGLDE